MSRFRPTPALVVALIALFVSLGGVGYAATKIGTAQIKNSAVTAKKLHKNAVTTKKVKNRAITRPKIGGQAVGTDELADLSVVTQKLADQAVSTEKLADLSVTEGKLADGAVTTNKLGDLSVTEGKLADGSVSTPKIADAAVTSPKIASEAVAADQLGGTTQAVSPSVAIAANGNAFTSVACPAGSQVLSGGGGANSFAVFAVESFQAGNGWIWVAHNSDAANAHTIFATAVCLNAAAPGAKRASGTHVRVSAGRPPVPTR